MMEPIYDDQGAVVDADDESRFRFIRDRFRAAKDADSSNRSMAADDMRFTWVSGEQWDNQFAAYGTKRPKYEVNRLRQSVKQVLNDFRQSTPSIKVRPQKDTTADMATLREGLVRNIEMQSGADGVYDWAAMYAITCGFGCWRVNIRYSDDDSFDQEIVIERIADPFTVWFDPDAMELDRSDSRYAFVEASYSLREFKERWPDAEVVSVDTVNDATLRDWFDAKRVRVCEYWHVEEEEKRLVLLDDGEVMEREDYDAQAAQVMPSDPAGLGVVQVPRIVSERTTRKRTVYCEVVSGSQVLEAAVEWPGRYIPLVPVWGDYLIVDGQTTWYGMARMARDAAVLNNFAFSMFAEQIATQPSAPFMVTAEQIGPYRDAWERLSVDNAPALPYVHVDGQPPPQRQMPPQLSAGTMALLNITTDAIKATTGIYDASLGQRSNETSGRAILARQREGDTANYDYVDSLSRSIKYGGMIVMDLVPHVYSRERQLRIIGADGRPEMVAANAQRLEPGRGWVVDNDLRAGKYDVTVTTGPSFATQRMETLDACMALAKTPGPMGMLAQYGALKNMDVPGMSEITDGMRAILIRQGLLKPSEQEMAQQQPQRPNPAQQMQMQKMMAEARDLQARAAKNMADAAKTTMETRLLPSESDAQTKLDIANAVKAQVDAMVESGELGRMMANGLTNETGVY